MFGKDQLIFKLLRFLVLIVVYAVVTAFIFLAAVPGIGKIAIVTGSVVVALFMAMYDFGLFSSDLEL